MQRWSRFRAQARCSPANRIIADYALAFFDRILKGQHVPLLNGPSQDYPEVEFTVYGDPRGMSGISDEEWMMY
ncbi:MAG: hypothetical protein ABIH23_16100 [bacterium]